MASTTVLISGANRGIGKALLQRYLTRPNQTIIAANRDPEHPSSKDLANLPRGSNTRLIVVKVDAASDTDALNAVKELERQGIEHLDLVIANAGTAYAFGKVAEIKIDDVKGHLEVNAYGVVRLFQATLPLLLKSSNPKWVTVGSIAGSLEYCTSAESAVDSTKPLAPPALDWTLTMYRKLPPVPNAAYGPSKSAVHWFTKRIDGEEEKLTAFVVHPGWVQTDMGNMGARALGMEEAPERLDESCDSMVKLFDVATKETHGGQLWDRSGKQEPW